MLWPSRRSKTSQNESAYKKPSIVAKTNEQLCNDIAEKLQLYGAIAGLARGKLPLNEQIDSNVNNLLRHVSESEQCSQLSAEGRQALSSLTQAVNAAKVLFLVKNEGNLLQRLVWDTAHATSPNGLKPVTLPIDKKTVKRDVKELLEGLESLAMLLVTNGHFRKLLRDATVLLREIASDVAQSAATSIRPSEAEVAEAAEPAMDNTWHDNPLKLKFSLRRSMKFTNLKQSLRGYSRSVSKTKSGSKEMSPANVEHSGSLAEKTMSFFEKKIPKDRRDENIWRLMKLILEVQGHPDYQRAIETLIGLAEEYASHIHDLVTQSKAVAEDLSNDPQLRHACQILKTLVESCANYTSLDDILQSVRDFYTLARYDEELRGWLGGINFLIRECLVNEGHILEESTTESWSKIYDQAKDLLGFRYRASLEQAVNDIQRFLDEFEKDNLSATFMQAFKQLVCDLRREGQSRFALKRPLLQDLKGVILPALAKHIQVIPIPRIEVSKSFYNLVIDDLILQSSDFFPSHCELKLMNRLTWSRIGRGDRISEFEFSARGLRVACQGAQWCLRYKRGSGALRGTFNAALTGDGLHFKVIGKFGPKEEGHLFYIEKVDVNAANLSISVQCAEHRWMGSVAKHIAAMTVRSAMEKFLATRAKFILERTDEFAHSVHTDAHEAKKSEEERTGKRQYSCRHYFNALRKNLAHLRANIKRKGHQVKTKLVFATRNSTMQHVKKSGQTLRQLDVYHERIDESPDWRSPVFDLGAPLPTSGLPHRPPIMRKPGYGRFHSPPIYAGLPSRAKITELDIDHESPLDRLRHVEFETIEFQITRN